MRKKQLLGTTLLSAALLLSACGKDEAAGVKEANEPQAATEEKVQNSPEKTAEPASTSSTSTGADKELNPHIAKESGGTVTVVYTNTQPNYVHNMDGFTVSVDEYQIVKVTNMKKEATIPFDDQTDGYVVTAKVTLDNSTGKAMYYTNSYRIQVTNEFDYISSDINKTFVPKEEQLRSKTETEASKFSPGEKVTGLVTFTLTNQEFDSLKTVKPKFIIEGGAADNPKFKGSFKGNAIFDFTYSEEQKQQSANQPTFYPDRMTTDNLADKKMIFEKTGINETKQVGDVSVTLDGVQYTEILPTPANKERFRNFGDSGIVAVTVKFKLDNKSNAPISISSISSKLHVDKNRGTALSDGMAEPRTPQEIKAGAQGEKYHVFLFRKDEFGLFKTFELEFGPFHGKDGKALFANNTATFSLPR